MIIVHTTICQEFIKRVIDGPKGRKVFVTLEAGGYSFRRKRITTLGISFKDLKSSSTRYFSIQYILSYDGVFKTPSYVGGPPPIITKVNKTPPGGLVDPVSCFPGRTRLDLPSVGLG